MNDDFEYLRRKINRHVNVALMDIEDETARVRAQLEAGGPSVEQFNSSILYLQERIRHMRRTLRDLCLLERDMTSNGEEQKTA